LKHVSSEQTIDWILSLTGTLEQLLVAGFGLLEEVPEVEGDEDDSLAVVELGLELDPVKTWKISTN